MKLLIQFLIFGIVDNLVMYKTGDKLDDVIGDFVLRISRGKIKVRTGKGLVLFCAGIGNAISDLAGGLLGGNIALGVLSFAGCMLVVIWIGRGIFSRV